MLGCQLALITNKKSHTGFRLVPTSVTLNDLDRCNSPYFAFFSPNSIALQADCITVIEAMMSAKYRLSVLVFHFRPKLTHPAVRSLCDSWVTCILFSAAVQYCKRSYTNFILWLWLRL